MDEGIEFILTGGTIDSYFDPAKDSVTIGKKSKIKEYISKLKLHNKIKFNVLMLKDSREIRYKDRLQILDAIKKSKCKRI